jgi:uncharacterized repeat protein (TIGR01451 family)
VTVNDGDVQPGGADCTLANGVLTCDYAPTGGFAPVIARCRSGSRHGRQSGTAVNRAQVGIADADAGDPNMVNNQAAVSHVIGVGDLVVTKTLVTEDLRVSVPFTYVIEVTNNGPGAMDYVLRDFLPDGLVADSWEPPLCSPGQGTVADGWCSKEALAPVTTDTFTLTVIAHSAGTFTNTAVVEGSEATPDGDLSNNISEVVTIVEPLVDLAVTKAAVTVIADFVDAGAILTYTVEVVNNRVHIDPDCCDATAITVTDQLPAGVTFIPYTPETPGSDPRCELSSEGTGLIVCLMPGLTGLSRGNS